MGDYSREVRVTSTRRITPIRSSGGREAGALSHIIGVLSARTRSCSTRGLSPPTLFSNAGQNHRRAVGEFSPQRQLPAHRLDGLPQRGEQQIATLFKPRDTVLGDPESLGHADLRELARVPQLAQGHFLGDQRGGAGLDLLALRGAQFRNYVVHVGGHDYLFSLSSRAKWASKRLSALRSSSR